MKLDEVILLTEQGVSLYLKTKSQLGPPEGLLLKVMVDGKGSTHLYADDEMKVKHPFVYHYLDWRMSDEEKITYLLDHGSSNIVSEDQA